jgi:hypothetical protein
MPVGSERDYRPLGQAVFAAQSYGCPGTEAGNGRFYDIKGSGVFAELAPAHDHLLWFVISLEGRASGTIQL